LWRSRCLRLRGCCRPFCWLPIRRDAHARLDHRR
jgi:hypothetical protein